MAFADQPIGSFLDEVASSAVIPSGGAVAAVGGASGAALCEMVCVHTLNKDGYEDVAVEISKSNDTLRDCRHTLLELADRDSRAVEEVQETFDSQRTGRTAEAQEAMKRATEVPLETAATCLEVLEEAGVVVTNGNERATADAVTGAFLAHAAFQSSLVTVRTNLDVIDDRQYVEHTMRSVAKLDRLGTTAFEHAIRDY